MKPRFNNIIIRSSGIWNTRSPLIVFNRNNHYINQVYYSSILAITKVQSECNDFELTSPASQIFPNKKKQPIARRAWPAFKRSFPSSLDGSRTPPTVADVQNISRISIRALTEYSIIKYGALFESFAQCWALNFLLARLESGISLTRKERELGQKFAPVNKRHHVQRHHVPGWPEICQNLPQIREVLIKEPHIKTDPRTGATIDEPITPQLNAFSVIGFWRDWRNSLVHKAGMVSSRFFNRNAEVWNELQDLFPTNIDLKAGVRLSLDNLTFRAVTAVHSRAAKALRDILVTVSSERRGHVNAPNKAWDYESGPMPPEMLPDFDPPMLMEGDHQASFLWATDESFREKKRKEFKTHNNKIQATGRGAGR